MNKSAGMLTLRRQAREVYTGRLLRRNALADTPPNRAKLRLGAGTNQGGNIIPILDVGCASLSAKEVECINNNFKPIPGPIPPNVFLEYWGRFGKNNTRTSEFQGSTTYVRRLWRTYLGGIVFSSPCISKTGLIYCASESGSIVCLDPTLGSILWEYSTGGTINSSPTLANDGTLYIGSQDGYIYSLNSITGALYWRFFVGSDDTGDAQVRGADSTPMILSNRTLIVGSVDRYIYCITTEGDLKWRTYIGQWIQSSAALKNGVVYIGAADYNFYALDFETGAILWNYQTSMIIDSSPAISEIGYAYFGSLDNTFYAVNLATRTLAWSYTTGSSIYSSPAVYGTSCYIVSDDGYLYAFQYQTGALRWRTFLAEGINISSPTIGSDGTVYVGCANGRMYGISGTTGAILWSYRTGGTIESSVAISSSGDLYFGSYDGYLYCLTPQTTPLLQYWGRFGQNNTRTSTFQGPSTSVRRAWRRYLNGVVFSSPCMSDSGFVYNGSESGSVYCLNPSTGASVWEFVTGGKINSSPTLSDTGTLYIGSQDGYIYSLNSITGALYWRFFVGSDDIGDAEVRGADSTPMILSNGTLIVGSVDRYIYCITTEGDLKWRTYIGQWIQSSAALKNGVVYIGAADYNFYALDFETGAILWNYQTSMIIDSSPAISEIGYAYFGSLDNTFYAVNLATRTLAWSYTTGSSIYSSPAVYGTSCYIVSDDGYLYAFQYQTGALLWRTFLAEGVNISSPTIGSDGTVYVGCANGRMYGLSGTSGAILWSYRTGGTIESSVAISSSGKVYFGSYDGYMYCLESQTTPVLEYWGRFGQNNTRQSAYIGPTGGSVSALWRYQTGDTVFASPSISQNGTVYVASESGTVYAFSPSGTVLWSYATGGGIDSSPTIANDGTIYVGSQDGYIYSFNGTTGSLNWRTFTGTDDTGDAQVAGADSSVMILDNGSLIVGSVDRYIYCLTVDGTIKWRKLTDQWVQSSAAVYQTTLLIGGNDYSLYALNVDTGDVLWSFATEMVLDSSPAVDTTTGICYVGSVDNKVYAININSGSIVWTYETGDSIYSSPALGGNGYLYITSDDGYLYALNASSGALVWRTFMAAGVNISSPTLGADGTVYSGCSNGKVYAFNGSTGTQLWSYQTGGTVESSVAIGSDGTIYVGSLDGYIYALR